MHYSLLLKQDSELERVADYYTLFITLHVYMTTFIKVADYYVLLVMTTVLKVAEKKTQYSLYLKYIYMTNGTGKRVS